MSNVIFRTSIILGATLAATYKRPLRCDYTPTNRPAFPKTITRRNTPFQLVSADTRKVTFLSISVYDVGLYVAQEDIAVINAALKDLKIDSKQDLEAHLVDPNKGAAFFDRILNDISFVVRITPVRNTDIAHIRDGFVRGIVARIDPDVEALESFKESFPNPRKPFLKESVMTITLWKRSAGQMEIDIDGHDYGGYNNDDDKKRGITSSFLSTYLSGKKVASESLRLEFIRQITKE